MLLCHENGPGQSSVYILFIACPMPYPAWAENFDIYFRSVTNADKYGGHWPAVCCACRSRPVYQITHLCLFAMGLFFGTW